MSKILRYDDVQHSSHLSDVQHAAGVLLLDVLEPGQRVQAGPAPRGRHVRAGEEGELAVMWLVVVCVCVNVSWRQQNEGMAACHADPLASLGWADG